MDPLKAPILVQLHRLTFGSVVFLTILFLSLQIQDLFRGEFLTLIFIIVAGIAGLVLTWIRAEWVPWGIFFLHFLVPTSLVGCVNITPPNPTINLNIVAVTISVAMIALFTSCLLIADDDANEYFTPLPPKR